MGTKDVTMTRSHWFARQRGVIFSMGLLITLTCLAPAQAPAQPQQSIQNPAPPTSGHHALSAIPDDARTTGNYGPAPMSDKQKLSIVQANFEKSKSDAAELAALAKRLREELDKPNANILSLEVINRAEKIEKLAKKIREETKGF
jgi:hypothetical protein